MLRVLCMLILLQGCCSDYIITIHPEYLSQGGHSHFEAHRWNGHGGLDWPSVFDKNKAIGTKPARWVNTDLRHDAYKKAPEDPHRKGYADPRYFNNHQFEETLAKTFFDNLKSYGYDLEIVMGQTGMQWPHWMNTSLHNHKFPNNLDAGTDMALLLLEAVNRHTGGHVPTHFEVINEPETMWEFVNWDTVVTYYHKMAEKIKKRFPKMKVGGPTDTGVVSMADRFDFQIWKRMKQFLDMALDHMDFYGFHSYNFIDSPGFSREWSSMSEARQVNVIDMIQSYSWYKKGQNFPIVITEYGLGGSNMDSTTATNFQEWGHCFMRNSQLFTLLNFRGDIDRAIPFLLNQLVPYAAASIYRNHEYTHIAKTYEFWQHFDYQYQFLRVDSQFNGQERHVSGLALVNPHTKLTAILLHNYHTDQVPVKLNFANNWMSFNHVHKTCFFKGGNNVPVLEKNQSVTLTDNVFHMPGKTSCYLTATSGHNSASMPTVHERTRYARDMVIPIKGRVVSSVLTLPALGQVRFATLRIGVSNKNTKADTKPHSVQINGHSVTSHYYLYQPARGQGDSVWDVHVYNVPANVLKQHNNAVRLGFSHDGGYVSTIALVTGTINGGSTIIG